MTNKQSATISVIDPATLAVARTITLPRASQPYGIAFAPGGAHAFVALEATGQLLKLDAASYAQARQRRRRAEPAPPVDQRPTAAVSTSRASSRRRCRARAPPPCRPPSAADYGGEVVVVDGGYAGRDAHDRARSTATSRTSRTRAAACRTTSAPPRSRRTARQAWVPSKQDNIKRGTLRDGTGLNFQNTVRAISSRIDLATRRRGPSRRASTTTTRAWRARRCSTRCGVYLFVALETSREVAVVDAHGRRELFRFDVGRAPQGLALSADGQRLYVNNFMDRTVGVFDLAPAARRTARSTCRCSRRWPRSRTEKLSAHGAAGQAALLRRTRHAPRARPLHELRVLPQRRRPATAASGTSPASARACATRSTCAAAPAGAGLPALERQLRRGAGLRGPDPHARRRHRPDDRRRVQHRHAQPAARRSRRPGVSADLDALAAYVASLNTFEPSPPYRSRDGSADAPPRAPARRCSPAMNCAHAATAAPRSPPAARNTLLDVGTIKPTSGKRLGGAAHRHRHADAARRLGDGARTCTTARRRRSRTRCARTTACSDRRRRPGQPRRVPAADRQRGDGGADRPAPARVSSAATSTTRRSAARPVLTRVESDRLRLGHRLARRPASTRTTSRCAGAGTVQAPATGTYRFQTGFRRRRPRVGQRRAAHQQLDRSTRRRPTPAAPSTLAAGTRYPITVEYYDGSGPAVARLRWLTPGNSSYVTVPADRLFAD